MSGSTTSNSATSELTYALSRRIYLSGLALVSLVAFLSLWVQVVDLVGTEGLLPIALYLQQVTDAYGDHATLMLPTLCWLNCSDAMLTGMCALGAFCSLCLLVGVAQRISLLVMWTLYLSLSVAGQVFLSFQWDTLLLEALFCSFWYAPRGWLRPAPGEPPLLARWLVWVLIGKLMFLSGATKLLSGDDAWINFTALQFHYFTQPLPNPLSWHAHHLPGWCQTLSLGLMWFAELIAPLLLLCGAWGRRVFAVSTVLFMVALAATGNYGFFNLLTSVLALSLFDDAFWYRGGELFTGTKHLALRGQPEVPGHRAPWWYGWNNLVALCLIVVSLLELVNELVSTMNAERMPVPVVRGLTALERSLLSWGEPHVLTPLRPWRTINGYGLFRVMTRERPEIVIEVSDDGLSWTDLHLRYKPGLVQQAPLQVAPHMPRLDWQLWFAALAPQRHQFWLGPLTDKILAGSPTAARLTGHPEIVKSPPRLLRLAYYRYEFTSPEERSDRADWWRRTRVSDLTRVISRSQAGH